MNTMESLLQSDAIQALGWTLVHAIWQIAGVTFLLMIALAILRGHSPRVRYGAALAAMISVVALSAGTFLLCYLHLSGNGTPAAGAATTGLPAAFDLQTRSEGYFESITVFIYRNLFMWLAIWITGVIALSLRFAGSMWLLRRLKANALPVSGQWAMCLRKMAADSGLRRAVRLAESAMVNTPVMIGHLKPLILVPAGMLAAIPPDQIEAILAHELAHIRRNDFLVNLLQSMVEIVYFFHPGIWWISGVARSERELCCDDMATRKGCDPVTLAFALSEMGEWVQTERSGKLALAFSGKREKPLVARVKRLLGYETARPSGLFPVGTLAAALVVFLLLSGSGRVFSSSAAETAGQLPPETGQLTDMQDLQSYGGNTIEVHRSNEHTDTLPPADRAEPPSPAAPTAAAANPEMPQPPEFPLDMSKMPQPPAADSLPSPPAIPAPPVMDSTVWSGFAENMADFGTAIANWSLKFTGQGDSTQFPEFKLDEEHLKEFERSMEEFGKRMEVWGEKYGKEMEAWAKANEPKMKDFELRMKQWEKDNEPRLKEYERKMEKYQEKLKEFQEQQKNRPE